jgi:hypothetical protein
MDADQSLNVEIKLGLDGQENAAKAKEAIAGVAQESGNLSQSQYNLEGDLGKVEKRIEGVGGQSREMYRVFSQIDRLVPGLGEGLRGAITGPLGMMAALFFTTDLVLGKFKEFDKELDAIADQAADPTFLDGIRARTEALMQAADAAQEYAAKLYNGVDGEQGIITMLNQELALQEAINEARDKADSAGQSAAGAKTRADEARGTITPEMAIQQEADEKKKAATDETAKKQAAQDKEVADKQAALAALQTQMPAWVNTQTGAFATAQETAAAMIKAHTDAVAQRTADTNAGGPETDKRYKELNKTLNNPPDNHSSRELNWILKAISIDQAALKDPTLSPLARKNVQRDIDESELTPEYLQYQADKTELSSLSAARARYAADQKTEPAFKAEGIAAGTAQKNADAQDKLTKELNALTDKIAATRPDENTATAAKVDQANSEEVSAAAKTNFGKDLDSEKGDANKILTGQGASVSAASQALIKNLGTMMAGHTVTLQVAAQAIAKADASNENFRLAFESFNKTSSLMAHFSQATVAKLAEVNRQLDDAARQIDNLKSRQNQPWGQ